MDVMVRYRVKADRAEENVRAISEVFAELERERPSGLSYASFRLSDGVSFVHLARVTAGANPLLALDAFKAFTSAIRERCDEPPVTTELSAIGSYRMFTG